MALLLEDQASGLSRVRKKECVDQLHPTDKPRSRASSGSTTGGLRPRLLEDDEDARSLERKLFHRYLEEEKDAPPLYSPLSLSLLFLPLITSLFA